MELVEGSAVIDDVDVDAVAEEDVTAVFDAVDAVVVAVVVVTTVAVVMVVAVLALGKEAKYFCDTES